MDYIYTNVDERFLTKNGFIHEWQPLNRVALENMQKQLAQQNLDCQSMAGGQLANTIANFAFLTKQASQSHQSALWTKVGKDKAGHLYTQNLQQTNIDTTYIQTMDAPTGLCASLQVRGRHKKAMLTSLSPAKVLAQLDRKRFVSFCEKAHYLFFTGYFFNSEPNAILETIRLAHQVKQTTNPELRIGLTLAAPFVARKMPLDFVTQYIDCVAGNVEEFEALTQQSDFEDVKEKMSSRQTLIYTMGKAGAILFRNQEKVHVLPQLIDSSKIVDITGAGDGFLAGVLFGLVQKKNLQACGELASRVSAAIIQVQGARLLAFDVAI